MDAYPTPERNVIVSEHQIRYVVKAKRYNLVMQMQEVATRDEALALKERFEQVPNTTAEIVEIHDPEETDLTAHTRELIEEIGA